MQQRRRAQRHSNALTNMIGLGSWGPGVLGRPARIRVLRLLFLCRLKCCRESSALKTDTHSPCSLISSQISKHLFKVAGMSEVNGFGVRKAWFGTPGSLTSTEPTTWTHLAGCPSIRPGLLWNCGAAWGPFRPAFTAAHIYGVYCSLQVSMVTESSWTLNKMNETRHLFVWRKAIAFEHPAARALGHGSWLRPQGAGAALKLWFRHFCLCLTVPES